MLLDVLGQPVQGRRLRRRGHKAQEQGERLVGLRRAAVAAGLGVEEPGVEGGPDLFGQCRVMGLVLGPPQDLGQLARGEFARSTRAAGHLGQAFHGSLRLTPYASRPMPHALRLTPCALRLTPYAFVRQIPHGFSRAPALPPTPSEHIGSLGGQSSRNLHAGRQSAVGVGHSAVGVGIRPDLATGPWRGPKPGA